MFPLSAAWNRRDSSGTEAPPNVHALPGTDLGRSRPVGDIHLLSLVGDEANRGHVSRRLGPIGLSVQAGGAIGYDQHPESLYRHERDP